MLAIRNTAPPLVLSNPTPATKRLREAEVPTASLSSYKRAAEIAVILKDWILSGKFMLTEPVALLPGIESGVTFKPMKERPIEE